MKKLARVSNVISSVPWAIEPRALDFIEAIVQRHLDGEAVPTIEPKPAGSGAEVAGGIAVISIHGPIIPRASLMSNLSGATSSEAIAAAATAAAADASVEHIVLDIDSPGGSVLGGFEAADALRAAAEIKPMTAVVSGVGASLAYLFASQAGEIYATRSSQVGSIGVIARHYDDKAATHNAGYEEITVASSRQKAMSGMTKEEITAKLRTEVDSYMAMFTEAVKRGRPSMDLDKTATGEVWKADEAEKIGLIDGIATLGEVLETLKMGVDNKPS